MSITQGEALPDVTQTTTTTNTVPQYYTDHLTNLAKAGETAMAAKPTDMIAGLDALQTQGYAALPTAADAYKTGLTNATTTADQAAKGIDPNRISALMNPYTGNVVNEMARLSAENYKRNVLPGLQAGFVGSGSAGSKRYANAIGQSVADTQSNLTGQQYGALSAGYTQAQKAALDEATLKNQAALTQGKLAGQAQENALTSAGALTKAGAEKQAYQQSILNYPMVAATNASNLLKGITVPGTQEAKFVGPKAGLYQSSTLADIMGVLATLGAGTGKDGKGGILADNLTNYLKKTYGSIFGPPAGGTSTFPDGGGYNDDVVPGDGTTPVSDGGTPATDYSDFFVSNGYIDNGDGTYTSPDGSETFTADGTLI